MFSGTASYFVRTLFSITAQHWEYGLVRPLLHNTGPGRVGKFSSGIFQPQGHRLIVFKLRLECLEGL